MNLRRQLLAGHSTQLVPRCRLRRSITGVPARKQGTTKRNFRPSPKKAKKKPQQAIRLINRTVHVRPPSFLAATRSFVTDRFCFRHDPNRSTTLSNSSHKMLHKLTLTQKDHIQRKVTHQSHLTQFFFVQVPLQEWTKEHNTMSSSQELPADHDVAFEEEEEIGDIIMPVVFQTDSSLSLTTTHSKRMTD